MFLDQNIQYSKAVISPDIDLQSQYNPNQNPSKMFVEIEKMILRITLKCKRPEVAGLSYRIILQDIKTLYKATVIKAVWNVHRNRQIDHWSKIGNIEESQHTRTLGLR